SRPLHRVLPARHRSADVGRLGLLPRLVRDARDDLQRDAVAALSLQVHHPRSRHDRDAAGPGRDTALRGLPSDRRVAAAAEGRRGDRRRRAAAREQHLRRRGGQAPRHRAGEGDRRGSAAAPAPSGEATDMSDAALGLSMLGLIVVVIMLGFPTAFTLMGLGMFFGFIAFYDPSQHWIDNRVFDLMVQRAFGAMTNETLLSIPLFVLMGYVMERGALVDRMFHSVRLAFRSVPGSLAVATLIICTFWGIASGLVGAVVVLMGVIAMRPMLNAGYDTRLAAGVITAGGTLGVLIPPSVMIIVYAAVAGQSVVKLYAAAMFPGFFLAFLYLIYVIGWAIIQPKVAPRLPIEQQRAPITPWVAHLASAYSPRMLPALF